MASVSDSVNQPLTSVSTCIQTKINVCTYHCPFLYDASLVPISIPCLPLSLSPSHPLPLPFCPIPSPQNAPGMHTHTHTHTHTQIHLFNSITFTTTEALIFGKPTTPKSLEGLRTHSVTLNWSDSDSSIDSMPSSCSENSDNEDDWPEQTGFHVSSILSLRTAQIQFLYGTSLQSCRHHINSVKNRYLQTLWFNHERATALPTLVPMDTFCTH